MTHRSGVLLVLTAGVFWSLGGLIVRLMDAAGPWQILFYRSATIFVMLVLAFAVATRATLYSTLRRAGKPAFVAGVGIAIAFTGFILSLASTTVANTFFLLATQPILIALLAWPLLGERVDRATMATAMATLIGIAIMFAEGFAIGTLFGNAMGLLSALGFTIFTLALRWGKNADMLPCLIYGSAISAVAAVIAIAVNGDDLTISNYDALLCVILGVVQVGLGTWCFTTGSRFLPAAELGLLAMTEIVLGPIWVWLVIGETPTALTVVGGSVVLSSLTWLALLRLRRY